MTNPVFTEICRGFYLEALLIDGPRIWYTDVTLGGVRLVGSDAVLLSDRFMIGGLLLNQDGSLLVAGGDGIAWVNPESGAHGMLVEGLGGVNEMRADGAGGLLFGSIDLASILEGKPPGPSALYHLAPDLTLTLLKGGFSFANGLSLTADGSALVFNESFSGVRGFAWSGPQPLADPVWQIDKPDCDGLALDVEGNLWITGFGSDHLLCVAPDGHELARAPLPGPACTNVRFMGSDMKDMVVCIVDPAGAQALAVGRPITEQNSALFKARSDVAGAEMARTGFTLPPHR